MSDATPKIDQPKVEATVGSNIIQDAWTGLKQRLSQGDIGSLPVILGLIVIAIIFQFANQHFLTPVNLTNLMSQIASVGTISVGVVLVLLLGEIDLSVGAVSGFTASIMAVLSIYKQWPGILAILAAVIAGLLIGLLQGFWFAKIHVPSFVVTLAGYLGWQGALLYTLGSTGTINMTDPLIVGVANARLPVTIGWVAGILFILIVAGFWLNERSQRIRHGLDAPSLTSLILRVILLAIGILAAVAIMNINRNPVKNGTPIQGVPAGVIFFLGFIVIFDLITRRTQFGRFVFATGGNVEAARRAGINVDRIRILIFMLCSGLAACGGVLAGSRLLAVNQASGSGDVLLNAIAAAVIGGTSLFGGRGTTWSALLGALVIGSIANGMDLLALASSIKFMVTGGVLLLAVTIDAYAHSRRLRTGKS
jgi:D-xylose transport system permease protein